MEAPDESRVFVSLSNGILSLVLRFRQQLHRQKNHDGEPKPHFGVSINSEGHRRS